MSTRLITMYRAQGFVEALVAIGVAGIATVVLMSVAVDTIRQTVDNEIEDEKTLSASNTEVQIDYLVASYNEGELGEINAVQSMVDNVNSCVRLEVDMADLGNTTGDFVCPYVMNNGLITRAECGLSDPEEVFTLVCVQNNTSDRLLYVRIVSGFAGCEQDGCKDHERSVIYPLNEQEAI